MMTDNAIRSAKPREKPYKLFDERGLFMLVTPTGARWWRFKFRVGGKEKLISLGVYPEVSLKLARERRDEARRDLVSGVDPSAKRKAEKVAAADSFEAVAREWFTKFSSNWAATHSEKIIRRLEADIFPWLGSRPVGQIAPPELLTCLRRIEGRGAARHRSPGASKLRAGISIRHRNGTSGTRPCR